MLPEMAFGFRSRRGTLGTDGARQDAPAVSRPADGPVAGGEALVRLRPRRARRKDCRPFVGSHFPFVQDGAEPHAAAFGVVAALAWSPEETNLILAADVPRCPEEFLAALLDVAEAIHAPRHRPGLGRTPQTLCSIWRKSALVPLTGGSRRGTIRCRGRSSRSGDPDPGGGHRADAGGDPGTSSTSTRGRVRAARE